MRLFTLLLVLMLLVALPVTAQETAVTPAQLPSVELPPDLDRVLRDYESAWRARDASALAALFADDGFILRPGHPPVRGRANIEAAYRGSGGPLVLRAFAYATDGDLGYILGGYTALPGGSDSGKYTLTLQKNADGHWLIVSDMDNGNR